ncbi:MAG: hypothetical protein C4543_11070 [Ignavibacteriales bacterium]|nr:MAG: hypothetical protein C4543_11070 [Ignavibacteriales bacterium]
MNGKIIYQLTTEDVQNVANAELERDLTSDELKIVADKIGDYIDWYEIIDSILNSELKQQVYK